MPSSQHGQQHLINRAFCGAGVGGWRAACGQPAGALGSVSPSKTPSSPPPGTALSGFPEAGLLGVWWSNLGQQAAWDQQSQGWCGTRPLCWAGLCQLGQRRMSRPEADGAAGVTGWPVSSRVWGREKRKHPPFLLLFISDLHPQQSVPPPGCLPSTRTSLNSNKNPPAERSCGPSIAGSHLQLTSGNWGSDRKVLVRGRLGFQG